MKFTFPDCKVCGGSVSRLDLPRPTKANPRPAEYRAAPCGHIQPGKVTLGTRP